jgi:hypothetical protein
MKKYFFMVLSLITLFGCGVFKGSQKTGCPMSGAAIGAERLMSNDRKVLRAARKSKFKGDMPYRKH